MAAENAANCRKNRYKATSHLTGDRQWIKSIESEAGYDLSVRSGKKSMRPVSTSYIAPTTATRPSTTIC
jgi:hypothetical protein